MLSALRLGSSLRCLSAGVGGLRGRITRTRTVASVRLLSTTISRHDAILSGVPIAELCSEIDSAEALRELASNIDRKLVHHLVPLILEHEGGLKNRDLVKMITACMSSGGNRSSALIVRQLSPLFQLQHFKSRNYSLAEAMELGRVLRSSHELASEVLEHIKSRILKKPNVSELSPYEMSNATGILALNFSNRGDIPPRCRELLAAIAEQIVTRPADFTVNQCFAMGNQLAAANCLDKEQFQLLENHFTESLEERDLSFKDLCNFLSAARSINLKLFGGPSFRNLMVKKCNAFDANTLVMCVRILGYMHMVDDRTMAIVARVMSERTLVFASSVAGAGSKDSDDVDPEQLQPSSADGAITPDGAASCAAAAAATTPSEMLFDHQALAAFFSFLVAESKSHSVRSIAGMFLSADWIMDFGRLNIKSAALLLEMFFVFTDHDRSVPQEEELMKAVIAADPADYALRGVQQLMRMASGLWSDGETRLATPLLRYLDQSRFSESTSSLSLVYSLCRTVAVTGYPLRGVVEVAIDTVLASSRAPLPSFSRVLRVLAQLGVHPQSAERLWPVCDRITGLTPAAAAALPGAALLELLWCCAALGRPVPAELLAAVLSQCSTADPLKQLQLHAASCGKDDGNGSVTGLTPDNLEQLIEFLQAQERSPYHVPNVLIHSVRHLRAMFPDGSLMSPVICATGGTSVPVAVLLDRDGNGVAWPPGSSARVDAHALARDFNLRPLAILPFSRVFFHSDLYPEQGGGAPQPNGVTRLMTNGLHNCGWDVLVFPWQQLVGTAQPKDVLFNLLRSKGVRTEYQPRWVNRQGGEGMIPRPQAAGSAGNTPPPQESRNQQKQKQRSRRPAPPPPPALPSTSPGDAALPHGLKRRAPSLPPSALRERSHSQSEGAATRAGVGGFARREGSNRDDDFVFGQD